MKNKMQMKDKVAVGVFFLILFVIGLTILNDFGLGWDEVVQRDIGIVNFKYISQGDKALLTDSEKYHGPVFELVLFSAELAYNAIEGGDEYLDSRQIYLLRHFITFLLNFVGWIFFYLLAKHRFGHWKWGIVATLIFVLSPRVFGQSFFNPKDVPFMSVFIIAIYTLIRFLEEKDWRWAIGHALSVGFLIGVRVMGILVPCITLFFMCLDLIQSTDPLSQRFKSIIYPGIIFTASAFGFTVLFWPILWEGPIHHLIAGFKDNAIHIWDDEGLMVLYFGKFIYMENIPWHYIPVWIGITTPLLYLGLFFVGVFRIILNSIKTMKNVLWDKNGRQDVIMMMWFFMPLLAVIILSSVLYDGWRHMFFIYPALIVMAMRGGIYIWDALKKLGEKPSAMWTRRVIVLIAGLFILNTMGWMFRYHPYQHVHFNSLVGWDMSKIKLNFETDYWGLTYRNAMEHLMTVDSADSVNVYAAQLAGLWTRDIIPPDQRKRLNLVKDVTEADYFISCFRWHPEEYPLKNEIYSYHMGNARLVVVYKLDDEDRHTLSTIVGDNS